MRFADGGTAPASAITYHPYTGDYLNYGMGPEWNFFTGGDGSGGGTGTTGTPAPTPGIGGNPGPGSGTNQRLIQAALAGNQDAGLGSPSGGPFGGQATGDVAGDFANANVAEHPNLKNSIGMALGIANPAMMMGRLALSDLLGVPGLSPFNVAGVQLPASATATIADATSPLPMNASQVAIATALTNAVKAARAAGPGDGGASLNTKSGLSLPGGASEIASNNEIAGGLGYGDSPAAKGGSGGGGNGGGGNTNTGGHGDPGSGGGAGTGSGAGKADAGKRGGFVQRGRIKKMADGGSSDAPPSTDEVAAVMGSAPFQYGASMANLMAQLYLGQPKTGPQLQYRDPGYAGPNQRSLMQQGNPLTGYADGGPMIPTAVTPTAITAGPQPVMRPAPPQGWNMGADQTGDGRQGWQRGAAGNGGWLADRLRGRFGPPQGQTGQWQPPTPRSMPPQGMPGGMAMRQPGWAARTQPSPTGAPTGAPNFMMPIQGGNMQPPANGGPMMYASGGPAQDRAMAHLRGSLQGPVAMMDRGGPLHGDSGGQDDDINAKLSPGEYVWSAQDVADLGDGNNTHGAKKLDQMRHMVRQKAGRKNITNIAPKQPSPSHYLSKVASGR